ncbi:MAG: SCO family protein [Luminiphilus sp.]|nr:SCO family protein [Luminiphilus sp.]
MKITKSQFTFSILLSAAIVGVVLAGSGYWVQWQARSGGYGDGTEIPALVTLPEPRPLAKFTLVDDAKHIFDIQSLESRWSFIFFGFMYCPDICPTTLQDLSYVKREILARGIPEQAIQFVFISVDPARDKSEQIDKYVSYFDAGFEGATGSIGQLNNLTRQLGAPFMAGANAGDDVYEVAHSSAVYLIDPSQRFAGLISSPFVAEDVAEQFADLYRASQAAARDDQSG